MIGKVVNLVCPKCGGELIVDGAELVCFDDGCPGCGRWPRRRRYTRPLPVDLVLRQAGAAELPGMPAVACD